VPDLRRHTRVTAAARAAAGTPRGALLAPSPALRRDMAALALRAAAATMTTAVVPVLGDGTSARALLCRAATSAAAAHDAAQAAAGRLQPADDGRLLLLTLPHRPALPAHARSSSAGSRRAVRA
jgi:hypothetical protein